MNTLYNAYQAYEHRVMRGEFFGPAYRPPKASTRREPLQAQLDSLFIHTGRNIKARYATSKRMVW
jgi:hypothetical protein